MQNTSNIDAVSQIKVAVRNPLCAVIGGIAGGCVPLGTYTMIHSELSTWCSPEAIIPAAGLVFSAATVYTWSKSVFASVPKALAFVTLAEGMMAFSNTPWLALGMLCLLIAVNAIANGCGLALRHVAYQAEQGEVKVTPVLKRGRPRKTATPTLAVVR